MIIWVIFWSIFGSLLFFFFKLLQKYYLCFQKLGALGEERTSQLQETSLTILPKLPLQVTMLKWLKIVHSFRCPRSLYVCMAWGMQEEASFAPSDLSCLISHVFGWEQVGFRSCSTWVTGTECPADTLTMHRQFPQVPHLVSEEKERNTAAS